jgi:hypothetical protein
MNIENERSKECHEGEVKEANPDTRSEVDEPHYFVRDSEFLLPVISLPHTASLNSVPNDPEEVSDIPEYEFNEDKFQNFTSDKVFSTVIID